MKKFAETGKIIPFRELRKNHCNCSRLTVLKKICGTISLPFKVDSLQRDAASFFLNISMATIPFQDCKQTGNVT